MDPVMVLVIGSVTWLTYWLSGLPGRSLERRRNQVQAALRRESDPRRRRELLLRWNDLGGYHDSKIIFQNNLMGKLGQEARMRGEPLSANPCRMAFWGRGRRWMQGWRSVDRQIRWIEIQRQKPGHDHSEST